MIFLAPVYDYTKNLCTLAMKNVYSSPVNMPKYTQAILKLLLPLIISMEEIRCHIKSRNDKTMLIVPQMYLAKLKCYFNGEKTLLTLIMSHEHQHWKY